MTEALFREDSYLAECTAKITVVHEHGIQTDRTVFYPTGGGQPGDTGTLRLADGRQFRVSDTQKAAAQGDAITHLIEREASEHSSLPCSPGDTVQLLLDWPRRYQLMRFHSCLHMLCAVIDAPVTSGSIQVERARLDFDLPEPVDKAEVTEKLNALIQQDAPMHTRLITDAELDAQPDLVRTLSVKPPRNASGTIRLVEFEGIDLQPCGGTHVASTAEIGRVRVQKIEKKGKQNRRVIVVFDTAG